MKERNLKKRCAKMTEAMAHDKAANNVSMNASIEQSDEGYVLMDGGCTTEGAPKPQTCTTAPHCATHNKCNHRDVACHMSWCLPNCQSLLKHQKLLDWMKDIREAFELEAVLQVCSQYEFSGNEAMQCFAENKATSDFCKEETKQDYKRTRSIALKGLKYSSASIHVTEYQRTITDQKITVNDIDYQCSVLTLPQGQGFICSSQGQAQNETMKKTVCKAIMQNIPQFKEAPEIAEGKSLGAPQKAPTTMKTAPQNIFGQLGTTFTQLLGENGKNKGADRRLLGGGGNVTKSSIEQLPQKCDGCCGSLKKTCSQCTKPGGDMYIHPAFGCLSYCNKQQGQCMKHGAVGTIKCAACNQELDEVCKGALTVVQLQRERNVTQTHAVRALGRRLLGSVKFITELIDKGAQKIFDAASRKVHAQPLFKEVQCNKENDETVCDVDKVTTCTRMEEGDNTCRMIQDDVKELMMHF